MIRLWRLWRLTARDLRLLLFALKQPDRPPWIAPMAMVLGVFAIEPLNFVLPFVGAVDEFILLPLALHFLLKRLPMSIHARFDRSGSRA
jgi:uncharacterized membrane protein YkvA (DUF1232 family)